MYQESTARQQAARQELGEFLTGLFTRSDVVELRLIETWSEANRRQSRFIERKWLTPENLLSCWPSLRKQNAAGVNVLFGVNPRSEQGSKKENVALCRTLWADLDNARPHDDSRWSAFPPPSVVVDSGHGVHLYWRLAQPVILSTIASRNLVEAVLRGMYRTLESDAVQDVSRLLRLPGFANVKDHRNGQAPSLCRLVEYREDRTYQFLDFQHFAIEAHSRNSTDLHEEKPLSLEAASFPGPRDNKRIRGLVRLLLNDSPDRSKRDFFVVTKLLALGCTPTEVTELVSQHSKFSGNETYLLRTIENALRAARRGR